jgi:hypothetical protein
MRRRAVRIRLPVLAQDALLGLFVAVMQVRGTAAKSPDVGSRPLSRPAALRSRCCSCTRPLGADDTDPSVVARIDRARLFLPAQRTIDEELEADIRKGVDQYQQRANRAE